MAAPEAITQAALAPVSKTHKRQPKPIGVSFKALGIGKDFRMLRRGAATPSIILYRKVSESMAATVDPETKEAVQPHYFWPETDRLAIVVPI